MNPDKMSAGFPTTIRMPEELRRLCVWLEQNGYPISGSFELRADDQSVKYWFGTDRVLDRFGVFGAGPDGSLYAVWLQDDGRLPIVHLGSEGENNMVLAGTFTDFLRLLAIGYDELGFDDLCRSPEADGINTKFQSWVQETFHVAIPELGTQVTIPAQEEHQNFQAWIDEVLKG